MMQEQRRRSKGAGAMMQEQRRRSKGAGAKAQEQCVKIKVKVKSVNM
jgi:hypothetical protein